MADYPFRNLKIQAVIENARDEFTINEIILAMESNKHVEIESTKLIFSPYSLTGVVYFNLKSPEAWIGFCSATGRKVMWNKEHYLLFDTENNYLGLL